jgi:hypothetical protein
VTPRGFAALMISRVTAMSAFDGVGSPEGWLCTRIRAEQFNQSEDVMVNELKQF